MIRRLLIFLAYSIPFFVGLLLIQVSQIRATYSGICTLIEDNYYDDFERFQNWVSQCHLFALSIDPFAKHDHVLSEFQKLMDRLGSSHFQIYGLEQDQRMWHGMVKNTGLAVISTPQGMMVHRVVSGSPADNLGFKVGDILLSIGGKDTFYPIEADSTEGIYKVLRKNGDVVEILMTLQNYQIDGPPKLRSLAGVGGRGVLEISSFRAEYFEQESWRKITQQLNRFSHLTIDIRPNSGGNFVSMLRALSPFFCQPTPIGRLAIPRSTKKDGQGVAFQDSLSDDSQLSDLEQTAALELKTFEGYGPCFKGRATVLISEATSSVAEIFAHAFQSYLGAQVIGDRTAGEVVLAVWYPLHELGPQYTISVPRAIYMGQNDEVLEGEGVDPDVFLESEKMWLPVEDVFGP